MSRATSSVPLRPLTPPEEKAVELSRQGVPEFAITLQTRLGREQIAAALERKEAWDELHAKSARQDARLAMRKATAAAEPDLRPLTALVQEAAQAAHDEVPEILPVPVVEPEPVDVVDEDSEPEPAAVDWDELLADEGQAHADEPTPPPAEPESPIGMLLTRAEASPQPRARELAADVRRQLAELEQLLGRDEQIRVLTIAAEVLRRQLATTEAELQQLLGRPAEPESPLATPAAPKPAARAELSQADQLAYSSAVRAWARANNWNVKVQGRMPGAVVAAYQKAHGGSS